MPLSTTSLSSNKAQELFVDNSLTEESVADTAFYTLQKDIMPELVKLQELFAESKHLFLSDDDRKMAQKYLDSCEKRIKELKVKIRNAQQLL